MIHDDPGGERAPNTVKPTDTPMSRSNGATVKAAKKP